MSRAKLLAIVRKSGLAPEVVDRLAGELPDPVDADRDAAILFRYGLTKDQLIDRMGGSP